MPHARWHPARWVQDAIIADEFNSASATRSYAGTLGSFNLDDGFAYILNRLRMPLLTGIISQKMTDADRYPAIWSAVNHAGHIFDPICAVFRKCGWKRLSLLYDPVQFPDEAEKFQAGMLRKGYRVDGPHALDSPAAAQDVVQAPSGRGSTECVRM